MFFSKVFLLHFHFTEDPVQVQRSVHLWNIPGGVYSGAFYSEKIQLRTLWIAFTYGDA